MEKSVNTDYRQIRNADNINDILCLCVLIADNKLSWDATTDDAKEFYKRVGDCGSCPVTLRCLACIINE